MEQMEYDSSEDYTENDLGDAYEYCEDIMD